MHLTFQRVDDKKHSVRFHANEAWQDGEQVAQDITERFTVYVPNDVLLAIGYKRGDDLTVEVKVK